VERRGARPVAIDVGEDGPQRGEVAVDVGEHRDAHAHTI
jgi:hypothetical protein